ncbi:hypothetical protein [Neptunomonas japonica]|uniref:hypothetical protein n=1 Tax=Neptunomonas japonica TaxID=417574 RepID=UPI001914F43F|nr:hypothetical protein [Neptunomonas japonica]
MKFIRAIVLALGIFSMYLSYSYFIDTREIPEDGMSCHALCGLTMLSEQIFGPVFARYTASILWLIAGLFICSFGLSGLKQGSRQ